VSDGRAAQLDLSVSFAGLSFKNPVIAASGTFGYGVEFEDIVALERLGGFVVKGLSREPMAGNPPPRMFETAAGMLNAIGLQNIGARAFVTDKLPLLRKHKNIQVVANVFGFTTNDYAESIRILNDGEGIAAYELNVSCPNTKHGGISFGSDPVLLEEVVYVAKKEARRPLIVKLSPNVTSIPRMARVAAEAGADALSLVNTFVALAIDAKTRRPRISNVTAGLSGPAIKPIALHLVSRVYRSVAKSAGVPLIGMGGIQTWQDAVEFLLAGASALGIGTALFIDPATPNKICAGLVQYMQKMKVDQLIDLVGTLEMPSDQPARAPYP
jgi:dihydroorotate dehydrogenase (NAD+) catalytic subunit